MYIQIFILEVLIMVINIFCFNICNCTMLMFLYDHVITTSHLLFQEVMSCFTFSHPIQQPIH